ncbi:hypothetical protein RRF57_001316 [Xylaria bambusicola]|uniref:Uncharacterized protein n=1 Tax=Xylaria bambusicola TaxID=326684 RepID=A0AAN7U5A7_9PEZI
MLPQTHTQTFAPRLRRYLDAFPAVHVVVSATERIAQYHFRPRTSITNDETVPLINLDREASRSLPRQQRPRRVRIQGRVAVVQTVSVTKSRKTKNGARITHTNVSYSYVRVLQRGRKGSYDGNVQDEGDNIGGYSIEGDRQFHGYGIGGAGNIRRPTDIIGTSSRSTTSTMNTKLSMLRLGMSRLLYSLRGYRKSKGSTGSF